MTARRVDVGGLALAVEEHGEGPPLVILHGFTGSAQTMAEVASALASNFRAIAVDLVGHGASDRPKDPRPYSMSAVLGQLRSLLEQLEIERAHWLGYSMGGRVALAFAAAHPERVDRLLLVGASAGIADRAARAERLAADSALAEGLEAEGLEAFVDDWMALPLFASQSRLGEETLAAARRQRLGNEAYALANSLRGMGSAAQEPLHDQLGRLRMPVCLVVGEEDAKFEAIARELALQLGNARVESIPAAGHAAHLENPSVFRAVAHRFFAQEAVE